MQEKQLLIAFNNPTEGSESEYNDWYSNTHIQQVVALPGFVSAHRFHLGELFNAASEHLPYRYITVYEVDDLAAAKASLAEAVREASDSLLIGRAPKTPLDHPALDAVRVAYWADAVSEFVTAPRTSAATR